MKNERARRRLGMTSEIESLRVPCCVVRFVVGISPVAVECRLELFDQVGRRSFRQTNVPFHSVQHRAVREIGRSNEGRGIAGRSFEQPCLRVQPRGLCVVRNLHLCSDRRQPVERPAFGRTGVDRCNDAQWSSQLPVRFECWTNEPETVPADKRTKEVDSIGGVNFALDGQPDRRLATGINEQVRRGQRNQRRRMAAPKAAPRARFLTSRKTLRGTASASPSSTDSRTGPARSQAISALHSSVCRARRSSSGIPRSARSMIR